MDLNIKPTLRAVMAVSLLGMSAAGFAASGQLVVVNSLAVVAGGSTGSSASSVSVVVNDATGPCSTTGTLAYNGVLTVKWDDTKTHSATQCTDITSVDVTALKTAAGVVQYDSTANTTPPAVATAPTNFVAPTTKTANLALMVTGGTSAAMTNSATSWGSAVGVAPVYLTTNGLLDTCGIMGAVGMAGLKAANFMHRYGVMPAGASAYQNW
ncbi:hypothetical protein Lgee_0223 [Legionella geestiana]|uniref:Uncharacterized protein n=1 Tax=Legionella geestiana TaxID=45065 RepID=A0A0W0U8U4_9GAMM|nr:hypothetical protein [Legionella geestiana]KTD04193.1 hypothetical protein Lgee_0223 [Legionella geestiana]STX53703.1 Uncharacterised protein [Legionella geestiana]